MAYTTVENKVSAGRVLIIPRGDYDSEAIYEMLDLVNFNGFAWLAKRTSKGIEPSNEQTLYWHNLLDIDKVVKSAVSETLAEDIADILDERFSEMLSEARFVYDLKSDFTEATFVQWDATTKNTPYTARLTESYKGFALVFGTVATNHTIVAWTTDGKSFTSCVKDGVANDWEKYISSSGGILTGPLGLGNGKGSVSADTEAAFLDAIKDNENYRRISLNVPYSDTLIEEAVKLFSIVDGAKKEYNLFGEHNLPNVAQIQTGSFTSEESGYAIQSPDFTPKFLVVYTSYTEYVENVAQNVTYYKFHLFIKPSAFGMGFTGNSYYNRLEFSVPSIEWKDDSCKIGVTKDKTYYFALFG